MATSDSMQAAQLADQEAHQGPLYIPEPEPEIDFSGRQPDRPKPQPLPIDARVVRWLSPRVIESLRFVLLFGWLHWPWMAYVWLRTPRNARNVITYLWTIAGGYVGAAEERARWEHCLKCVHRHPYRDERGGWTRNFCGPCESCGCGLTRRASLEHRNTLARYSCPLKLWS